MSSDMGESEATGIRRIEPVETNVTDIADEVADELERSFAALRETLNSTHAGEESSSQAHCGSDGE